MTTLDPAKAGRYSVSSVAFRNVLSFVLAAGVPIAAVGRALQADVAFSGALHAIVDVESAGLANRAAVGTGRITELRT